MSIEKISLWLGIPGLIVGTVLAIGTVFGVFGFQITTPEQTIGQHIQEFSQFKTQADSIHYIQKELTQREIKHVEGLSSLLVRRSCVRDSYDELALQGFLPACEDLGIVRRPNDRGAREAVSTGQPLDLEIEPQTDTLNLVHSDTLSEGG